MPTETSIEERLAAVEAAVAELKRRLEIPEPEPVPAPAPNWLEKVIGSVSDIEGFDEVLEYGRAFRHADRPADDDDDPEES